MTYQAEDRLVYLGDEYELLYDSSRKLPMIAQYGIEPVAMNTACWKGFIADYLIRHDVLYLTSLAVSDKNNHYPDIGNVKPINHQYSGLLELMAIDGHIVIGKGDPPKWGMGDIRMAHDYQISLKLKLLHGIVQSVEDISAQVATIRAELYEIFIVRQEQFIESHQLSDYKQGRVRVLYDQSFALMSS